MADVVGLICLCFSLARSRPILHIDGDRHNRQQQLIISDDNTITWGSSWSQHCITAWCTSGILILLGLGAFRRTCIVGSTFSDVQHYSLTCREAACIKTDLNMKWHEILNRQCCVQRGKVAWCAMLGKFGYNFGHLDNVGLHWSVWVKWPSGQALQAYEV